MTADGEKVEMEQVPLKADTDEKPAAEEGKTDDAAADKKSAPKKTWFFTKDKKKADETAEEEKKKKTGFWSRCKGSTTPAGEEDEKPVMTIGIDMQMRDEKNLNEHVKINFEDVFGEPDSIHSIDCAWRVVYRIFEFCRTFFFKLFALVIGIPAALIFGIFFAFFTALTVYFVTPLAKLLSIPLAWIAKSWNFVIHNVFDPVTSSLGLCFSNVSVRNYGINNAPTDLIAA